MVGIPASLYASPLYIPGYTPVHTRTSRLPVIAVPAVTVRDDEALGSRREKDVGERPLPVLKS